MDCPKCNTDMEILDYTEEDQNHFDDEIIVREWKCKCPKCGYEGTYTKVYELDYKEWDYVE